MTITFFKNLFDKKPYYTTPEQIFKTIQTGGKHVDLIKQIRMSSDKGARDELKKGLGVILWSGKFTERRLEGLAEYSHLICLDFDDVDPDEWKEYLKTKPYVWAAFESPSGDGCKAIVKVSSTNHQGHFKALAKELEEVDPSGKDIPRACFMSHDPDIYINEHAEVYTKIIESVYTNAQKYDKLKNWLSNKGEKFVNGSRNNFLTKLAGACNRFGIDKDFVLENFEKDYVKGTDFSMREAQGVVRSIYDRYADQFDTVSFDDAIDEKKFVDDVLSTRMETHDVIYLKDVESDLLRDFDEGTQKGETTHFPSIDNVFRWMRGDLNVLGGIGNYGKSAMQKQLDLVRAALEGKKFAYHSREEYPPMFWYRELIRTLIGKPIEKDDPMRMTRQEYERGMEFVKEHFYYIYPPKLPTPQYMLERYAEAIIKHGVDGVCADPWNQFLHVMSKRDDIYLGETLSEIESFLQQMNVYGTIVAHPNRTSKNPDGNYECPDVYDFNGGPVWNARATNILIYHRPFYQTDKSDPTCEFHSKKIKKQMISGLPGTVVLTLSLIHI